MRLSLGLTKEGDLILHCVLFRGLTAAITVAFLGSATSIAQGHDRVDPKTPVYNLAPEYNGWEIDCPKVNPMLARADIIFELKREVQTANAAYLITAAISGSRIMNVVDGLVQPNRGSFSQYFKVQSTSIDDIAGTAEFVSAGRSKYSDQFFDDRKSQEFLTKTVSRYRAPPYIADTGYMRFDYETSLSEVDITLYEQLRISRNNGHPTIVVDLNFEDVVSHINAKCN